ncbi:MAG TPA: hypothetical protein VFT98_10990 [Myxococcota bacterium]|nr:hypothetical protein [Myxococcota bacterium]
MLAHPRLVLFVLALASPALSDELRDAGSLPAWEVAQPSATVVSEENLLASERFWPYRVAVTKRDLSSPLAAGSEGVLIRVENGARARIDFGRDGVHTVPVAITNLVDEANKVRLGELKKLSPNLTLALGPRLSGSALGLGRLPLQETTAKRGFLVVFADPKSEQFDALAKSLAPFQKHPGVLTVLLPQSLVNESTFGTRLASLGWTVPYVYDYLAAGYTDALLPDGTRVPAVTLQSAEGRLVFEGAWSPDVVPALRAALEAAFPETNRVVRSGS